MGDYKKIDALVEELLEDYDRNDPDYQAAEPFLNGLKDLFEECYTYSDFCVWLAEHDADILIDFRKADIVHQEDYKNPDDWEEAKEDALLMSDDGTSAVLSWWNPALTVEHFKL